MLRALPPTAASPVPRRSSLESPPPREASRTARPSQTPMEASIASTQRLKRNGAMVGFVVSIILLINWNASRLNSPSTGLGLGSARVQGAISNNGYVRLPSGATVRTASAEQGDNQCISKFKTDSPTAQCQTFCSTKFKKFHCTWCKCRACTFCPKGGEAIEEAAKDAPPPAPPPPSPPPPPPEAASFVHAELESEKADAASESESAAAALDAQLYAGVGGGGEGANVSTSNKPASSNATASAGLDASAATTVATAGAAAAGNSSASASASARLPFGSAQPGGGASAAQQNETMPQPAATSSTRKASMPRNGSSTLAVAAPVTTAVETSALSAPIAIEATAEVAAGSAAGATSAAAANAAVAALAASEKANSYDLDVGADAIGVTASAATA